MDVQTENMDPPPCESQPSGKIRKGFKLFGKRKPGNIFSIRSKGDGNNKSPVKSKTLDGLSESAAPDLEQESEKEKAQEVSQGDREQAEEEPLGEDGVLAAAPARTSISSASSAKSLSFLSLLRGGRRGVGDRRVHTVSQPVGRQRRGLKGLFGNVKFRSKDKEDKEEAPPSPLLMSSRANSVEIIKEDLTLTPKSQPRSPDSSENESSTPVKSFTTQDSAATSPSKTITPQVTAGNVSRTYEHLPLLPTPEPPLIPGDNSLSSLLADISSLLTFDSISGGGDIMADVEAEWGKASSAISAGVSEVSPSPTSLFPKPTISSPLTTTFVSTTATAKPPTTASTRSFTSLTKTASTSSPIAKPSTIITTLTKSSTLTTHSVKLSSDSTAASASTKIKSAPTPTQLSTTPVTLASLSVPIMSSSSTIKSTTSSTSATTTAPPNTPATVVKAPSITQTLTSTASKLASEIAAPPPVIASVSRPSPVVTPPPVSAKPPPLTRGPPTPVAFTQPPPTKLDSATSLNLQTSTTYKPSLSSAAGESKTPVTVPSACAVTNKPSFSAPVIPSKITAVPKTTTPSTTTSGSVSVALSKPTVTPSPVDLNKTPSSLVTGPDLCPSSTPSATIKTQPSPASVPTPSSVPLDEIPPTTKPSPPPVSLRLDNKPPAPTPTQAPTSHAVVSTASPLPPALGQIPVSQSKAPPAPTQIPVSVSKDPPAPAQIQVSVSKVPPAATQIPVSVSKVPPEPAQIPVSVSKGPPAPAQNPVSVSKVPPVPAEIPVSVSKVPPEPVEIPVSVSKVPPEPAQIPVSVSKVPPAQIPVSVPKAPPAPTPAPCPVTSLPPALALSEAPASAKMRGSGQASVDWQLASRSSAVAHGAQTGPSKTEELNSESQTSLQGPSRERRTPPVKASGLSKIPVVGGGRVGKLPVRDSQHVDDEASRNPPTPVLEEERPHFNSHDAGSKDKVSNVEFNVPTLKHTQEESHQPPQLKVLTSLPRDSKIPVKHGAQSHTASQIPQAKEPHRTKIPVSKVPVRRVGNKPAVAGGSTQIRK
ncbi:APC membrane recruitment protein 2-like isoform X6 [Seriola lalandi dorsalis]|uniref:APC membrane recruitment protein 2-like isoform X6 n=1 Tax=Seriola lalandi dorsalis TaxID=1841481 RepID=UPI000C6FA540|nr:APC membrane recruitment protein 2-like isoform X6 [Seriola lalandi dorsalis]